MTPRRKEKPQKILFVYSRSGGGHYMASKQLAATFQTKYKTKVKTVLVDIFADSNNQTQKFFTIYFLSIINNFRFLFAIGAFLSQFKFIAIPFVSISFIAAKRNLKKVIKKEKPDKIITTYFCTRPIAQVLRKEKLKTSLITIVTENYTPPKIWFLEKDSKYIIFSEQGKQEAANNKIPKENIEILQGLVNPKFTKKLPKTEIRHIKKDLGLDLKKRTILLFGGGFGLTNGDKVLDNMLKEKIGANIILVTGRNFKAASKAKSIVRKHQAKNVLILSFVDFIYELINIADFVVGKGGAMSTTEILTLGKPLIICDYVWPQEKGNVDFVTKKKVGFYEPNEKKLAKKIKNLLKNPKRIKAYENNIKKSGLKNETNKLAEYIYKLK